MLTMSVAQISDCHLYEDKSALHYGANVFDNLQRILDELGKLAHLDAIVFTGDLTQDHSLGSYLLFNQLIIDAKLSCPLYVLAGNHDDEHVMATTLTASTINHKKHIEHDNWQLLLTRSKSETPAGFVDSHHLQQLANVADRVEHTLLFMHHHPVDVGYFIDRHGLNNQADFWQAVEANQSIRAVACGHIHRGQTYQGPKNMHVYACPATSIQFDPDFDGVKALPQGAGYRQFMLHHDGTITTTLVYLD
ncbi:metallophosphoesterase [Thalassotalea sp. Y01]|uniref:metallophosphoesterase n=1 Tax=Thalassotalea sp. Y01 TaxID=2729613 RepID=UPI00145F2869|nr:metallophosphoesterase [Thalassotalea sp. Y01]NMP15966.1 3',5'-cyclic-nucleotide phosphodiesterase [Thalassotalea sp. Y01]